jgi:guanine deaminase
MDTGHDTYVEASAEASMAATKAFVDHFATYPADASARVTPILTPRFALSCTAELMRDLGALAAERDLPIQTHISENHTEIRLVKEQFGDKTYAGVYDRFGLLRPGTILAHGVHLDDAERSVIARSGAGVSHCPGSNVNLNSGAARVLSMLDSGIPVGLGSDCSGGAATGILAAIRDATTVSRVLTFEDKTPRALTLPELFFLATRGGAQLCRMDDVGNFVQGNQFDALWVKPASPGMWVAEGEATEKVFEKWLFTGDDRDIAGVWVAGKRVAGVERA